MYTTQHSDPSRDQQLHINKTDLIIIIQQEDYFTIMLGKNNNKTE